MIKINETSEHQITGKKTRNDLKCNTKKKQNKSVKSRGTLKFCVD